MYYISLEQCGEIDEHVIVRCSNDSEHQTIDKCGVMSLAVFVDLTLRLTHYPLYLHATR